MPEGLSIATFFVFPQHFCKTQTLRKAIDITDFDIQKLARLQGDDFPLQIIRKNLGKYHHKIMQMQKTGPSTERKVWKEIFNTSTRDMPLLTQLVPDDRAEQYLTNI